MSESETVSIDSRRVQALLVVLSIIAGSTDAIGFLGLNGLFTAHITGNLAILAARIVGSSDAQLSSILSVPAYMIAVSLTKVFASKLEEDEKAMLTSLLVLQLLFLLGFLAMCVVQGPKINPNTNIAITAGMLGVCAMAVQNVLVQVSFKGAPPTAIMTSNVTRFSISIGTLMRPATPEKFVEARAQAKRTLPVILGFSIGCALGAAAESMIGMWSLFLPSTLAVIACLLPSAAGHGAIDRSR
ncbi:MAG: DUF1275 domain-containing protein [Candidatus Obscuribacterales bacterium]|nr:DUF1275 domain-containing protein [Candidatus Obscuribacterales bacterium]